MSQLARNTAYNNNAAVADAPRLIQNRNERSAAYRNTHPNHLDLSYGTGERQKWDLYGADNTDAPCFVFIHGGYWQMNRREDFAVFATGLVTQGWSVALPGYSLAPEASLNAIVSELHQALDWLAVRRAKCGVTGPVIVSGWSAGGHLAALLLKHELVTAGLALSGVYELGPIRDTYLNDKLRLSDEEIERLSPLRLPVVHKPLAIGYGTHELPALIEDSRDLHAYRAAAHASGILLPIAGANHFTILEELLSSDGILVAAAKTLI